MTLVGEMLAKPRFDAKDVDRERQLQLTGLVQGPDSPQWIARRAFRALLYGKDHPYGSPSEGTTEGAPRTVAPVAPELAAVGAVVSTGGEAT